MAEISFLHLFTIFFLAITSLSLKLMMKEYERKDELMFGTYAGRATASFSIFIVMLAIHPAEVVDRFFGLYGIFSLVMAMLWFLFHCEVRLRFVNLIGLAKIVLGISLISFSLFFD